MRTTQLKILFGAVAVCAAAAGIWFNLQRLKSEDTNNVAPLWAAQFQDLSGKPMAMAGLRGKPVIVNFWATWCGPCKEEMPDFQRLAASPAGQKAKIVGIGIDSAANMQAFAQQLGISYLLLEGGANGLDILSAAGDKPRALPFTIVLDAAGKPVFSRLGKVNFAELSQLVAKF
jgi:thiol-disulfide isomerase/thioredoxin